MTAEEFEKVIATVRTYYAKRSGKPVDLICAPMWESYAKLKVAESLEHYVAELTKANEPKPK